MQRLTGFPYISAKNSRPMPHLLMVLEMVFQLLMEYLAAKGLVNLEEYYVDGTKIETNANRYSFVWKKSVEKNQKKLREKVKVLLSGHKKARCLFDKK